ncbi:MAG: UDP-3-O-(3-hydroxymyristoyl)glucosamine N-acyltransferase [Pseudomonadota bacterium]
MSHTIAEIAAATGLDAVGDLALSVRGASEPAAAGVHDLALAMAPKYAGAIERGQARAAVLWPGADWRALGLAAALFAPRARVALSSVTRHFEPALDQEPGIHPTAVIDPAAVIGADVWLGPYAVVRPGARLGEGVRVGAHATIGRDAEIGEGGLIGPGVRVGHGCRLGARVRVQANAVIGGDGFSYVTPETGAVEDARGKTGAAVEMRETVYLRIASLGAVVLADDVEIGANACIDRGTVRDTTVGQGTKIDNLVMVGHNGRIGANCLICGHVGLAGSVTIGERCVLGGKVGVGDNLTIGDDVLLAGGSLVGSNIKGGQVMMGAPAGPRGEMMRAMLAIRKLPRLLEQMREVRAKLGL